MAEMDIGLLCYHAGKSPLLRSEQCANHTLMAGKNPHLPCSHAADPSCFPLQIPHEELPFMV